SGPISISIRGSIIPAKTNPTFGPRDRMATLKLATGRPEGDFNSSFRARPMTRARSDESAQEGEQKIVRQPRRAFSLFELLLVIALIVLLAAIAYPTLDGALATFRITEAADMVRACWADARAHAMNEGQAYRFAVLPGQGNFRVAPDSPDYWG